MESVKAIGHPGTGVALALLVGVMPLAVHGKASGGAVASSSALGAAVSQTQMSSADGLGVPGVDYVENEILVTFRNAAADQVSRHAVQAHGDSIGEAVDARPSMARVRIGGGESVADAVRAYRHDPNVAYAQPNYIYKAQATPNDPDYGELWGLENNGQFVNGTAGTAGQDIDAAAAWDLATDCSSKRIAVLDTGVNYGHADLADNMWDGASNSGRDFVGETNDDDPLPDAGHRHGTHVAGVIGAAGDNSSVMTGVCWQAELMSVRVLGGNGLGVTSDIIEGVDYAVNNGADLINMSLGQEEFDQVLKDSLENARANGVLVIAAAGNEGENSNPANDPVYPCSFDLDNIICVAALDQDYSLADFSNFGDTAVDVGAPGVNIRSAIPGPRTLADFGDWVGNASWRTDSFCEPGVKILVNPVDWCGGGTYTNNLDARAYGEFDLTDSIAGGYTYSTEYTLAGSDLLQAAHKAGTSPGDPFEDGVLDGEGEGPIDSDGVVTVSGSIADCAGTNCSIGFRLATDASDVANGVAVAGLVVRKVVDDTDETGFLSGTSMATPYVTGIAALAWSVAPDKGYREIRAAVLEGGDDVMALDANTTTGRAVDALKAIREANDPPVAQSESAMTVENTPLDVSIAASDPNNHSLDYSVATSPSSGSLNLSGNTVSYTPDPGFIGSDSFAIEVEDGFGGTDVATVTLAVEAEVTDDEPVDEPVEDDGDAAGDEGGGSSGGGGGGGAVGVHLLYALVLLGLYRAIGRARVRRGGSAEDSLSR
ncbi:S8 family serine peptidase [Halofilum ochraceum]|uniref:S8 family serine peptidase n=1 Tax=Halofilum ochraceum TaxID=1611323 RepID=UPI0008D91AAE|nr:S8 family serine peptidase [Halofilum ochraceum]